MEQEGKSNADVSVCPKMTWDEIQLKQDLLRGIYAYGFESPSDIQKRAILPILEGRDILAQAQSGSGKTGSFTIGTLNGIDTTSNTTQALILAPTHELAKQIANVAAGLGSFIDGLRIKTIVGGTSIQADVEDMRENLPHIIVGCAGRIYDMIRRHHIHTSHIRLLVLDEADEMLSRGFKPQVYMIFQQLREDIQVALFSATLPEEIVEITQKFMRDPVEIRLNPEELSLECIQQTFVALADDHAKYETLKDIFATICVNQCIIYCNSVNRVVDLYQAMTDEGFSVCAIHSSMDKAARESVFTQFRTGTFRVLISSNITARGIDVQQVSTVVNFDIPKCVHTYLHRIGRSGRWGRKGLAINFVTRRDIYAMRNIEKHYKISMEELKR